MTRLSSVKTFPDMLRHSLKANKSFVRCMRSQALSFSSRSSADPGEGQGSPQQSQSSSSINRERELISAQFRAAQDPRDLDNGVEIPPGMESLQASGLMEEEAQLMPTYMAAASHSSSPSKLRLNRYSQTGYYNPYPSYVAAFPSVPPTYYGYNNYPSYREKQMFDPIYDTMQTRAIQSQAAPTSFTQLSSVSNSNRDGNFYGDGPPGYRGGGGGGGGGGVNDNEAAAGGHSGGHGWGGWGWTSKVNTNGIGLLGLLGLLSLLSNVLLQFTTTTTTTTTAAGGRRKRDLGQDENEEEDHEKKRERIFMEILPHLTPVAFAPDGSLPLECTFHGVCMANKILVTELGVHGRVAGARISSAVVKLLDKDSSGSKGKSKLRKKLESAALHGRDKKDCEKKYPICSALKQQEGPNLPFVIRMQELPQLISKISTLSQGGWGGDGGVPMSL